MVMIHRPADSSDPSRGIVLSLPMILVPWAFDFPMFYADPYLPNESNPLLTQALSSSLWELYTHREHYHSSVSTLAKIFSEAFTKPGYSMEDFFDHTYSTVCSFCLVVLFIPTWNLDLVSCTHWTAVRIGSQTEGQERTCAGYRNREGRVVSCWGKRPSGWRVNGCRFCGKILEVCLMDGCRIWFLPVHSRLLSIW